MADDLLPDLLGEKDMKSAWKNKPFKVIGIIFLFLVDFAIAIIPAGLLGDIIDKIKVTNNLTWLINLLYHISFFIVFVICFALLVFLEYLIVGLIVSIIKKSNR